MAVIRCQFEGFGEISILSPGFLRTIAATIYCTLAIMTICRTSRADMISDRHQNWLRPYLEKDAPLPEDHAETDKQFILENARKIRAAVPDKLRVPPERARRILVLTRGSFGTLYIPGQAGMLIVLRGANRRFE
mgnify:CR=1 FL=1